MTEQILQNKCFSRNKDIYEKTKERRCGASKT
jgi:hypothetical protein